MSLLGESLIVLQSTVFSVKMELHVEKQCQLYVIVLMVTMEMVVVSL